MSLNYSVIIPAYNEELFIEKVIKSLVDYQNCEIIIADGGSSDRTIEIAEQYIVKIVRSDAGRGIQLNEAAKTAKHDILCFLHADTRLPENAFELLDAFFSNNGNNICRFKLGFDINHWLLDRYKKFSKFDSLFTRFGDMAIAVRKDFYNELGGYPKWKTFEDVEFLRKAAAKTNIGLLSSEVVSSARTFTKYGLISQQIYNGYLMSKYLLGFRKFILANKYYSREPKNKEVSLIVFIKHPTEGKVKTRLAKTIGNRNALIIYRLLAENILSTLKSIKNSYKYIFYSDKNEKQLINNWIKGNYFYAPQEGEELGERMKNAFRLVFSQGASKAIIIGTDIPDLSKNIVQEAVQKLNENDIVIGPSPDGGYYLLGMKKFNPFLFENIIYSTNTVFNETVKKLKHHNLSFHKLKTLEDIDTEEELNSWLINGQNNKLKNKINKVYNNILERIEK